MTNEKVPEQFDWVHARSECSLPHVFKELEQGVRTDIEAAEALMPERYPLHFSVAQVNSSRFSAVRVDDPMAGLSRSINFVRTKDSIEVHDDRDQVLHSASLGLNNEGKCRLFVNDKELTQWQFRKMALEKLFFGPHE
ncbi:MAG: hypothetical protein WCF26_18880 [Candidatus Sulfotelmatobacter sp.]